MSSRSDLKAYLLAVILAATAGSVPLSAFFGGWDTLPRLIISIFAGTVVLIPFVAMAGVVIGLPIALALRTKALDNLLPLSILGTAIGGALSLLLLGPLNVDGDMNFYILACLTGALPGLVAALCWARFANISKADVGDV